MMGTPLWEEESDLTCYTTLIGIMPPGLEQLLFRGMRSMRKKTGTVGPNVNYSRQLHT
jgi:hypothetical protein